MALDKTPKRIFCYICSTKPRGKVNFLAYIFFYKTMAIKITDECINCGACEPECPNNAIYDAGAAWRFSDGTGLKGVIDFGDGNTLNAEETQAALNDEVYYIVPDKCTECVGFHDEPQCAAVCPVDCCVDDEDIRESKEELLAKKEWLHLNE
jgi:ferredoxin